mmetsp:Transcript_4931/g.12281  ORF Transcript_4931/g.12281 Transcript_4931/m.12281 type:complete len:219 (+) Transcript_4931:240-896(+)
MSPAHRLQEWNVSRRTTLTTLKVNNHDIDDRCANGVIVEMKIWGIASTIAEIQCIATLHRVEVGITMVGDRLLDHVVSIWCLFTPRSTHQTHVHDWRTISKLDSQVHFGASVARVEIAGFLVKESSLYDLVAFWCHFPDTELSVLEKNHNMSDGLPKVIAFQTQKDLPRFIPIDAIGSDTCRIRSTTVQLGRIGIRDCSRDHLDSTRSSFVVKVSKHN